VWMYFFTVLLGLGVIVGWFGLLEWLSKRRWERYLREFDRRSPSGYGAREAATRYLRRDKP
jgi:hypothetical protein